MKHFQQFEKDFFILKLKPIFILKLSEIDSQYFEIGRVAIDVGILDIVVAMKAVIYTIDQISLKVMRLYFIV